jgi:protein-S-isoprenylcysteine O-methyltransferase Ste14
MGQLEGPGHAPPDCTLRGPSLPRAFLVCLSYILRFAALPLALGSVYAIIPVAAGILVMVIRTNVEDTLLLGNLAGYKECAQNVRYRLLPPLW